MTTRRQVRATATMVRGDDQKERSLAGKSCAALVIVRSTRDFQAEPTPLLPGSPAAWRSGRFVGDAANDGLVHGIHTFSGIFSEFSKAELGAGGIAGNENREMTAEIAFNVRSLVPFAGSTPSVDPQHREIAALALSTMGSGDKILRRLAARAVWHTIELEPGYNVQVRGTGIVAHGTRQIRL